MASVQDNIQRLTAAAKRRRRGILIFVCMAVLVSFGVERLMRQQGITLTTTQQVLDCKETGIVAHTHNADCYDQDGNLVCPLPERPVHLHGPDCYADDGSLVCGQEETEGEHVHGSGCFRQIEVETPDPEPAPAPESEPEAPAEDFVDDAPAEDLPEDEIYDDHSVDKPTPVDAAANPAQTFHEELKSEGATALTVDVDAPEGALPANTTMRATLIERSKVDDALVQNAVDKLPNGAGGKVLDLQAADITFVDANGKEVEPARSVTVRLTSKLIENSKDQPNVVHVEDAEEARERAKAQGKNPQKAKAEGKVVKTLSAQELAMRDEGLEANQVAFNASRFSTYVLAITSQHQTLTMNDGATLDVTVDAPAQAGIPAEAKLEVKEVAQNSDEYKAYKQQALDAMGTDDVVALARFFNIRITNAAGETIQPSNDVNVKIKLADAPSDDAAQTSVVHFADQPEIISSREDAGTTQFEASSISVYGVLYTVDFLYENHEYTLPGGGTMLLSELIDALHIELSLADIESVEFTNPDVLTVELADAPTTIERLTKAAYGMDAEDEAAVDGDADANPEGSEGGVEGSYAEKLVAVPLADGEEFEEPPALTETIDVVEGDWILTSRESFETPETLKILTKDKLFEIAVTDPPAPPNPWGPGFGFFGGTATWDLGSLVGDTHKASLSVSYDDTKEYSKGDEIELNFTYQIEKLAWTSFPDNYNPWMGYPTFTYDIGELLKSGNFKDLKASKSHLTFGGKKRGTIEVTPDGKITIQITDTNWFNTRDEIGGTFNVKLKIGDNAGQNQGENQYNLPGGVTVPPVPLKVNISAGPKKVTTDGKNADNTYTLKYTASVKTDALDSLVFEDTLGGKQTLGTVKVNNQQVTVNKTSAGGFDTGFTYEFPRSGDIVSADTYNIEYTTTVDASVYEGLQGGGTDWTTTNKCNWKYNGDKNVDGGSTTYEISKAPPAKPTVTKTSTPSGGTVNPGGTIDYTLTITGTNLADMNITDTMTDIQTIQGTPTVSVSVGGNSNAAAATSLKNAIYSYNADSTYNTYGTQVLGGAVPKEAPFNGNDEVTITITYTTKVIDQETATASGIYGEQNVNNTLSENWSWQQHTTTNKVKYEDETVTKVTKTADSSTLQDTGTYTGSTLDGSVNGVPDTGGTITYTIIVGDGTTTLDGVKVKDYASGDQKIIENSYTIEGSNVTINPAALHSYIPTSPQQWDQTALDFTFPAGTGTGPVTITYQAKPYPTASTDDKNALAAAGILGKRNLANKVSTGTDEDTTSVPFEYPDIDPFNVQKRATPDNGGNSKLEPGETVAYEIYFGKNDVSIGSNGTITITDEMTDIQKLTGDVKVEIGTATLDGNNKVQSFTADTSLNGYAATIGGKTVTIGDGSFNMPAASNGWADDGITWGHFNDGSYNDNMVRVFNFKFPTFNDGTNSVDITNKTIRVTYTTTIISADEAAASRIMGKKTATNTALSGTGKSSATVEPEFPANLNHNPAVTKEFSGWDDDGYTTWWTIGITTDEESSFPLKKLTLTEDWANGSINYSTDWPVQNFNKNVLADIDLLGAEIVTDSGITLQPGRDYTIDKEKGSFYFEELDEPVSIRIAIHNPDATINTFYQRNKVNLTWQKDAYNSGQLSAEATGRRVKQEVDLTKSGKYDPDTRLITWTVIFNPYFKEVTPEMSPIQFVDTLAPGLELDGDVAVAIAGNDWQNITIENAAVTKTPLGNDAAGRPQGTKITIANLDPQNRWGTPVKNTKYYHVVSGGAWEECTQEQYGALLGTETLDDQNKPNGSATKKNGDEVVGRKVVDVGLGLSKNSYTITYKTKLSGDKWDEITSSLTGKEVFENKINIGNGFDQNFSASNKVTVEGKDYLIKHDVTREDSDGYVIDEEDMHDNAICYEVEVNPKKLTLNSGKALTLTDRIDTIMDLDTDTVKVYAVSSDGTRSELSHAQLSAQGITISYNDDTRVLAISGLADKTSYVVSYEAISRAFGTSTYSNTATLVGGGSHSDNVSDQHNVTNDDSSFWGNRHAKLELKKIDENDITNRLNDATFSLYKVNLATDTSNWTRDDWMDLLDRVNSGDEAVLAQVAEQFKITGKTPIVHNLTAGSKDPKLMFDDGFVSLEYDQYTNVNDPTSFVESAHDTFLKEHTVYYWEENTPPTGFHATDPGRHYFVVYLDGELDDDYTHEEDRKKAAWALDDAVTIANKDQDVTIASMASDSVWNVNNTRNGYTSITATKRWEGDYDNVYETRPKNGILYDLYRVDPTTGKETLMEDVSPVPINDDGKGYWSSYTWYRLDSSYKYTVKERAVPGYITTYSDNGKGVASGVITVTNTYVPKSTDIYVQKKWDPEGGPKSSQVKVQLYKIVHEVNDDGTTTASEPESMGSDFTYMLTAANNWSHSWKGLDTSDPNGNTISYTVREDVDAVNKDATVAAAHVKYGAVYSDGGAGTVDAPKDDPLVITNLANAPGSLKITKNVTVNGEHTNDTAADGVYRFRITDKDGNPATRMHDHNENCTGNAHNQYLVGDVTVHVQNGVATSTMVDNLEEGTYYVYEYTPESPMTLVSDQRVEVKVVAGVTEEDKAPEASFTNNIDKNRVEVTKKWMNSNNGVASWPEGIEVQVQVMKKTVSGEAPNQTATVEEVAGVKPVWLTNNQQSYMWDLPNDMPALGANESYVVVETAIKQGEQNGTVTADSTDQSKRTLEITAGGTTKTYVSEGKDANAGKEGAKGVDYTLTNRQVVNVPFQKQWGADGCGEWPSDVNSIKIQLFKDGQPYSKDSDNGIRILKKESGSYKAYKEDDSTLAGDVTDVPTITPTVGGHRYNYTFTGLESGNYTVREININSDPVPASNLAAGYMVQQVDGTTVRNVSAQTTVSIQKKWLKSDGEELTVGEGASQTAVWPQLNGQPLTISGTITRERRPKGSTLEVEWAPDAAWNATTTGDEHTFTVSNVGTVPKTLAKYGADGDKLYEYRYTATENTTNGVTADGQDITDLFTSTSSRNGDALTVTNTPKPTEISFQKKWQNADGSELAWPQENGSPVRVPITVKQQKSTYNGSQWSASGEATNYGNPYNLTSNRVVTVANLPEYAYEVNDSTATLVKYSYTIAEPTAFGGFSIVQSGGKNYSGTGTESDPYVITNKTDATSLKVEKQWKDASGQDVSWPTDSGSPTSINGTITRQRRPYGTGDAWEPDGSFTPMAFEIQKDMDGTRNVVTASGAAATDGVTYAGMSGTNATFTQSNLPTNGYVDGAHYEFKYVATEAHVDHYTCEATVDESATPRTYTLTNTPRDDEMSVTVKKTWETTTGRPVTDLTGKDATFTLHQVRYAALTVNINDTTSDSVILTINEDGVDKPVTLTKTNGPGYTYNSSTGWTYTYAPMLKGKNYTVAVSSLGGTYTGQVVGESGTSFTAGDQDYTANFSLQQAVTPTLTVQVTSIDGQSPVGKSGEMAVNIYNASNNQYVGTIGLKDDTWNWVRTNKQATFTFDVTNEMQYYAEVGSFAGGIGSATVVTGSKTNPITINSNEGLIEITATSGTPTLTVTADGLGANDDGSIVVTVTPDYAGFGANPPTPQDTATQYTLDKSNNWTISHTMDGRSGTVYTVSTVTPDGTHITNAVVDSTGVTQTHGTESATIKVTPTTAPKSLVITLPNPPNNYRYGGWIAVNLSENDAYKTTYNLTNENNWTVTVGDLNSAANYTVNVGSFEANTYSSVTAPSNEISGRTGGEFDLSSIQPGPPMLTIVATDRNPSDLGWLEVTVTKVTNLHKDASERETTYETVRLNAANSWTYDYPMNGDSNTSYTVTYNGSCDGTYVTNVTVDSSQNSTRGAYADTVVVNPTIATPPAPKLTVNVNNLTSGDSGWICVNVLKNNNPVAGSPITLSKDTNPSWTYELELDGQSSSNYEVTFSGADGSVIQTANITQGGGTFDGTSDHTVSLNATKVAGNGTLTFSAPSLVGHQSGFIKVWYQEQGPRWDWIAVDIDPSNNWEITITGLNPTSTYKFGVNGYDQGALGNIVPVCSSESVVGGGTVIVYIPQSSQAGGRIASPVTQLFKRRLAHTGDPEYAMVDLVFRTETLSNGASSYTWNNLPKYDAADNPIKYYVTEECNVDDVEKTHGDGKGYTKDDPLDATGDVSFTNKVPETNAEISVRKVFKDANGNTLSEVPSDVTANNTKFTLKRLKTAPASDGQVHIAITSTRYHGTVPGDFDKSTCTWNGYLVDGNASFGSEVTVTFNGLEVPKNSISIYASIGGNQYDVYNQGGYPIIIDDNGYKHQNATTQITFAVPSASENWSSYDSTMGGIEEGTRIYGINIKIDNDVLSSISSSNTAIGASGGMVVDNFSKEIALSDLTYNSENQSWQGTFTDGSPYPLKEGTTEYTYYVEESGVPAGYATSYKVVDTDVTVPTSTSPDGTGWLNGSGTVTVTNKQTTATVKVRKKFVDAAGNAITPAEATAGSATFKLQRFEYNTEGGSSDTATADSTYNNDSSQYQSQTLSWSSSTTGAYLEVTFNPVPLVSDDGTKSYIYYVEESGPPTGYTESYSVDGDGVVTNNPAGWLEGNGTVTVTNKDTTRTSVEVEKKWEDVATGAATTTTHANDAVEFTLYRTTTNTGTDPTMGNADNNGLIFPTSGAEVVPTDNQIVTANPVTVSKDSNDQWKYAWRNLPTTDNNVHDYTYFVKETGIKRSGQPVTTGMHAVYDCDYADGKGSAHAASGVAKAIITNSETSVTATKKWQDVATGADTTAQHTGDTATFTLYKLEVDAGSTPDSFSVDATTGRALPQGAVKVSGNDTLGNAIPNDVAVSSTGDWTCTWNNLPLQNAEDATNVKDIYYYVVESGTRVGGTLMEGDTASSYVYGTNGDGFNTASDPASGVKNVIITNRETGVKVAKTWYDDQQELDVSLAHRGQTVTLELWRALKMRGTNAGVVGIADDGVTNLAFPANTGAGAFASFERVDSQVIRYDVTEFNWNYEWEHLPSVVVKDGEAYEASYYVRESANSESAVSAWYDATYVVPSVGENSGVSSVAITNHETSVKATKTWSGGGHTEAGVTLELWKAVKAPVGTAGTFNIVQDATSGLAFPVESTTGDYLASARMDRATLKYDATFNNGAGGWHTEWNHLPTHEDFLGVTYELVYYVREAETTENGQTYPASARYVEEFNTSGDKDSGVKSVAIENYETSVKAVKVWADQSGNLAEAYHRANDHVTFELWKARKNLNGEYGVSAAANSLMRFPRKVTGNGKFDAPELVDTKNVAYNESASEHWAQEWTRLPLYETVDGKTYELAYFVREKSVFTDGAEYMPSPTYDYVLAGGGDVNNDGANGGTVTITNHETSVEVEKVWAGFTDFSNYTATAQLYKARKAIDGLSGAYKVATDGTSHLRMPEPKGTSTGVIESYEPFPNAIGVAELKHDESDATKSFKHKWINLPMYETDPNSGLTYKLEYFVKETAASAPGITTTYAYEHHDNNQSKGISKVTITNTNTNRWSVKVDKHWTGGNAGHEGVAMELTRYTKSGDVETKDEGFLKTITLDDGNNWEYTWTGLDSSITISGNTYTTTNGTLIYKVAEKYTDENNVQRKDFALEYEDPNDHSKGTKWPDYQTGTNADNNITYWVVTNKPVYTGKLKIKKTFDGIELSTFAGVSAANISQEHRALLEAAEKKLQYDITTVDSQLVSVTKAYNKGTDENPVWTKNIEDELVRTTWHLVHDKNNGNALVWVKEPVQNYDNNGNRMMEQNAITIDGQSVIVAKDESYDDYAAHYATWETAFKNNYDYVTYADFTNGEFQIVDSPTHTGTLSADLVMDRVYDVTELNANALIANHTLVADKSATSASGHAPKEAEDTIGLTNTYAPVKGTLRVTKDVTLNGEKYDDVAAGKTFTIGIERWDAQDNKWQIVFHDVTTTQTMRLENGLTTDITTIESKPWTQTVTMGKGSTATVVFDELPLGTYRAYEIGDDEWGVGTPIVSQEENADNGLPIAGYKWQVTETGSYYTYEKKQNSDEYELKMVDGSGTHEKDAEKGGWANAADGSAKVTIASNDEVSYSANGQSGDSGVVLSAGTENEKSPRNAEITITNRKSETGSITVNKTMLRNGIADATRAGNEIKFGLYKGTPPTTENAVKDPKGDTKNYVATVTLGKDANGNTTYEEGGQTKTYDGSWGAATFSDLQYKDDQGEPITYYVYELDGNGDPITTLKKELTFRVNNASVEDEYTIVQDNKGKTLEHDANPSDGTDTANQTASFTNNRYEKGRIKVTKRILGDNNTVDTTATGTFKVGLFTLATDDKGTTDTADDTQYYKLVPGRTLDVEVTQGGTADVVFENLNFDIDRGTTYYVFEVNEQNEPVAQDGYAGAYQVGYPEGTAIQDAPIVTKTGQKFELMASQYKYDGETPTGSQTANPVGAIVNNTPSSVDIRVLKVDKRTYNYNVSDPVADATKLAGAKFTLTQIDENVVLPASGAVTQKQGTTTRESDATAVNNDATDGLVTFGDVTVGYYEAKETAFPTGYVLVGDSTFYFKVAGGKVVFLQKEENKKPSDWTAMTAESIATYNSTTHGNSNIMRYEAATTGQNAVPATVTVGNVAGAELPSTGGEGTSVSMILGAIMLVSSLALLRRRFE
ncbi:MAG: Cna B-type domain-containing protein [Atopobiaceae bacterium]|nr:Cna B-type domain-containing protein [Atopobiaceae bacterium]